LASSTALNVVVGSETFALEPEVMFHSDTLKHFVADMDSDSKVPFIMEPPYTDPRVFEKVLTFLDHYKTEEITPIDKTLKVIEHMNEVVSEWSATFVEALANELPDLQHDGMRVKNIAPMVEVAKMADYLHVDHLKSLCTRKIAMLVHQTKNVEECHLLMQLPADHKPMSEEVFKRDFESLENPDLYTADGKDKTDAVPMEGTPAVEASGEDEEEGEGEADEDEDEVTDMEAVE